MEDLASSLFSEGGGFLKVFIQIGIIKIADIIARITGNLLRRHMKNKLIRMLFFIVLCLALLIGAETFYKAGLKPNLYRKYKLSATVPSSEVRDLYRKLARQSHPDLVSTSPQLFVKMSGEVKILTNEKARWLYDRFGEFPKDTSTDEEFGHQVARVIEFLFDYLGKMSFILIFLHNDANLNTKTSVLGLVLVCFLFDIYNITSRRLTTRDPLDLIFSDLTLYERSNFLRGYFPLLLYFVIAYKFAFSHPWIMQFREVSTYSNKVLQYLQNRDREEHRQAWEAQTEMLRGYFMDLCKAMKVIVDRRNTPRPDIQHPQNPAGNDTRIEFNENGPRVETRGSDRFLTEPRGQDSQPYMRHPSPPHPEDQHQPQPEVQENDPRQTNILGLLKSTLIAFGTYFLFTKGLNLLLKL